ncbi:hypothetical protein P7K49_010041 [Saguinus oedipus]|uniref:Laminin alpha domain-containing protein n=1 Tax=Saguinus oedipus TaxID=9490 RepID=A0ABQ9VMH6_SAGOE|nr:hypothetical protein P7K49_010041 [Saguinus oedipus]
MTPGPQLVILPCPDPMTLTCDSILPAVCDHCVVLLLDDLEQAGALLPAIHQQLRSINASSAAWTRLHRLNASIADLQSQLRSPLGPRHETAHRLEVLEQQSESLRQDAQRLGGQAGAPRFPGPGTPQTPGPPLPPLTLTHQLLGLVGSASTGCRDPRPGGTVAGRHRCHTGQGEDASGYHPGCGQHPER